MIITQPILKDEIITLKQLTIEDTQALFEMRSDPQVSRLAGITTDTHQAQTLSFILDVIDKVKNRFFYYWGIYVDDVLVGVISLWGLDYQEKSGELGYFIGRKYQRLGYMSRAIKLVVNYALTKTQIKKIFAYIETTNHASKKLTEKLGFKLIAESLEEDLRDTFIPMYQYEIRNLIN